MLLSGDRIYNGDITKWRKFINSFRLRIANRILKKDQMAIQEIRNPVSKEVFISNVGNAGVTYENNDRNATPMYRN
ncbi:MAG: SusD/RagB family nutrient-binding outer membrane lipoprotein [Flavobacteriales bacterium AspAUS03]